MLRSCLNRLKTEHWILGGSALLLLYFAAFPLLLLIFKSISPEHIQNYALIVSKKSNWISLLNTLSLCITTTALTIIIGLPLAWLLYKTDIPQKNLWKSLFSIPYIIPPYVGAIAWLKLLNPTSGSLNLFFMKYLHLNSAPFQIYSLGGAAMVLGFFFYSFIFLACYNALQKMDPSLEEAALMCGSNRWQAFKDITLPLILPALMSGIILVFIATATAFGVPALLMMPQRLFVLTTRIYTDVLNYSGGILKASSLSVILMIFGLTGLWASSLFLKNKRFTTLSGKYARGEPLSLQKWKWPCIIFLIGVWGIMVFLPLITIVISSFLKIYGEPLSFSNFSFQKYRYVLFELATTQKSFLNSFLFATLASLISVILGALVAYVKVKTHIKSRHWITFLATLPYATPGTVVAIGLIIAFSGSHGLNLYNTFWILIVAYSVKYISFAIQNTAAALEQIDSTLEESGRMCGASWLKVFATILVPILKPTLIASFFLIFMPTFCELTMSILLVGPKTETVGTLLFNLQSYDDPQSAAVLATLIICVILTANFMVKKITRGAYGV
ncbi:MAG: hypothetical protein A2Z91_00625 [Deltaproteobacteria bacterium GWA2_38_16]|nr:MAG: hypothetical protein A2Z91_00625 [Deltaproteobacteria bacterium GWA2_38_16]OGQ03604.1 MAG: hypothetical protein A3D19_02030 [Deltaproteobacteria bacterium RIFCSPHIGHO2_02_FULL_38_15]OGQ35018.1 MAG: hypothetical protein A3A72_07885 [Deltaproteobacteria bacterium RIFCSPLOWO2_01_FULL_38_9]